MAGERIRRPVPAVVPRAVLEAVLAQAPTSADPVGNPRGRGTICRQRRKSVPKRAPPYKIPLHRTGGFLKLTYTNSQTKSRVLVGHEVIQPGYPKDKGDRPNTVYPLEIYWSGRGDLNTRHPAPKAALVVRKL